jgi:hypothetical protein
VRCTGNANGMEFVGVSSSRVDKCQFIGNVGYGLKLTAASTDNEIRDCFATGNGHGYGAFDSPLNRIFDDAAHTNTGFGLHVVRSDNCTIQSQMAQRCGVGVCFDETDNCTLFTGNVQWNGTGIQFIDSDNNLVYSTPTQLNSVVDFDLDANSNTNTIAHNFYITKADLGVGTCWQNNHHNSPSDSQDVATVSFVRGTSHSGLFESDSLGDLTLANVISIFSECELDAEGDLMPLAVDADESFELDALGDVQPKEVALVCNRLDSVGDAEPM